MLAKRTLLALTAVFTLVFANAGFAYAVDVTPGPLTVAPGWAVKQLTSASSHQHNFDISGNRIAWEHAGGLGQVRTWREGDSSPTTLVASGLGDYAPRVYGDRVAFLSSDGFYDQIALWTAGSSTLATMTNEPRDHGNPSIDGDRLVWSVYDGSYSQIVTWKVGSAPTTVTLDARDHNDPVVSGDRIAWTGSSPDYEVCTKLVGESAAATPSPSLEGVTDLTMRDGRAAWCGHVGGVSQIFTWGAGDVSARQLTTGAAPMYAPAVSGDRVTWISDDAVLTWCVGETTPTVIAKEVAYSSPKVSGNRIVWVASQSEGGMAIRLWSVGASQPTTLVANALGRVAVGISGNRIAWNSEDASGVSQIFTAKYTGIATSVGKPTVSGRLRKRSTVTFSAMMTPGVAAAAGRSRLSLWRWESKTLTKKVRGKKAKVKVHYWRLRKTLSMNASVAGKLTAKYRLPYSGKWKASVAFAGSADYLPSTSRARSFSVK